MSVPFHRPDIGDDEIAAVTRVLASGWLTTGRECRAFEEELGRQVGVCHAVAVSSCTAALHLALEATDLPPGGLVLVPTLTFAATAAVVSWLGGTPVLVDCEHDTLGIDVRHAAFVVDRLGAGLTVPGVKRPRAPHAIVPVHYGGQMADVDGVAALARRAALRVVEDAAHALPAEARAADGRWRKVGTTAEQTCFSFYANKTITTGEGGMLVTDSEALAERARRMSLHGLSSSAWERFSERGSWDYRILQPGFKYNLTDVAAALGRVQLQKAEALAAARRRRAERYAELLADVEELELPRERDDRRSAWHLYPVRLRLERLAIDRARFIAELQAAGISASVHWRPLHLQPWYKETFGYRAGDFPVASAEWERLVSLPLYPSLSDEQQERVAAEVRRLVACNLRARVAGG
jgi:perosamine synthetase